MKAYKAWNAVSPGSEAEQCVLAAQGGYTGLWEGKEPGLGGDRQGHGAAAPTSPAGF